MDYGKKYKDALGMAEEIIRYYKEHNRGDETSIEDLEQIFPELKESEDERIRKDLLAFIKAPYVYDYIVHDRVDPWIAWLEKQGEPKQEWSDEDEKYLNAAIKCCDDVGFKEGHYAVSNWLRELRPQNHWKPSEEQIEAIRIAAEVGTANNSWAMEILKGLYNELKRI